MRLAGRSCVGECANRRGASFSFRAIAENFLCLANQSAPKIRGASPISRAMFGDTGLEPSPAGQADGNDQIALGAGDDILRGHANGRFDHSSPRRTEWRSARRYARGRRYIGLAALPVRRSPFHAGCGPCPRGTDMRKHGCDLPMQTDIAKTDATRKGLIYRTRVELDTQKLVADGQPLSLTPGMQGTAQINPGTRIVMEYLLSPVQKAFQEAGRER